MGKSNIEWLWIGGRSGRSLNPVIGCSKYSDGCDRCYAERTALWLQRMGNEKYKDGFKLKIVENADEILAKPTRRNIPSVYFVCSMSDLFHNDVPVGFIQKVFQMMNECPQHVFIILTKRSRRLAKVANQFKWTDNIWCGVTVESSKYYHRIDDLLSTPAHIKLLSLEPLRESMHGIPLEGIDWIICGGESGEGHRPIKLGWVRELRDLSVNKNIPFFYKQFGAERAKCKCCGAYGCRILDGKLWNQSPLDNQVIDVGLTQFLT